MAGSLSMRTARSYVTHADDAPGYWMIGVLWRVLATGVQTGNAICLLDQLCSAGAGPARHVHPQEEGLYVVSGSCTFQAGGVEFTAGPGSFVSVPRHIEHSFIVDTEATLINFYLPAGFELFIMGSAVPAQRNELPPPETPPPPHRLIAHLSDDYSGLPLTQERTPRPNPDATVQPHLSTARTAETVWYQGGRWSVLADGASTSGSYCVFEVMAASGTVQHAQLRHDADEVYYVLEGEAEFLLSDQVSAVRRGSMVFVPRGTVGAWRVGSDTVRFLVIHTRPGYERLVRCLGMPATAEGLPGPQHRDQKIAPGRLQSLHAELGLQRVVVPDEFQPAQDRSPACKPGVRA